MKRFFGYFAEIVTCSVNPLFYRKVVARSALSAFAYFIIFTTLFGFIAAGVISATISSHYKPLLNDLNRNLPEIQIRMIDGQLWTTLPQPMAFGDVNSPIIIDTFSNDKNLSPYKSAIWVTRTKVVYKKNAFETREFNFQNVPNFSLTKSLASRFLEIHKNAILSGLFWFLSLVLFPFAAIFLVPLILFFAVFMLIFALLIRAPLRYGQVVSLLFYTVTLPAFICFLLAANGSWIAGMFFLLWLVWSLVAVIVNRKNNNIPIAI
jgi:hypothetical protein